VVMRTAESVLLMCWPPHTAGTVGVDANQPVDLDADGFVWLSQHGRSTNVVGCGLGFSRRHALHAVAARLSATRPRPECPAGRQCNTTSL
jgi:hypothetical protein